MRRAMLLIRPIPDKEFVNTLMKHLPVNIQSLGSLSPLPTIIGAAEFLRQQNLVQTIALTEETPKTMTVNPYKLVNHKNTANKTFQQANHLGKEQMLKHRI